MLTCVGQLLNIDFQIKLSLVGFFFIPLSRKLFLSNHTFYVFLYHPLPADPDTSTVLYLLTQEHSSILFNKSRLFCMHFSILFRLNLNPRSSDLNLSLWLPLHVHLISFLWPQLARSQFYTSSHCIHMPWLTVITV